jgi:hypothetical protein
MKRNDLSKMPIATNAPLSIENIHPTSEGMEAARKSTLKHLQQGTITWYEIAKGELPPVGNDPFHKANNWSDMVLISNAKKGVIGFGLCTLESGRFSNNNGNWQPTHWAFINLPQPQTP